MTKSHLRSTIPFEINVFVQLSVLNKIKWDTITGEWQSFAEKPYIWDKCVIYCCKLVIWLPRLSIYLHEREDFWLRSLLKSCLIEKKIIHTRSICKILRTVTNQRKLEQKRIRSCEYYTSKTCKYNNININQCNTW